MSDPASADVTQPGQKPIGQDLRTRLVSAVVLAAVALGLLYWGLVPFAVLIFGVALAMSWEWGRLVRGDAFDIPFYVHAVAVAIAVVLAGLGYSTLGLAVLAAGAIAITPLTIGDGARFSALGVFYTGLPAIALLWFRAEPELGLLAVLFIFLTVAASDTGAYFAGRLIGGPKLWPAVSPNKTWSGLGGAVAGSTIAAVVFGLLAGGLPLGWLAGIGFFAGLIGQAGDLAESALKRAFGVKDASGLIPGHGGFMDRMDGIVAAASAAALLALWLDPASPAKALLHGG